MDMFPHTCRLLYICMCIHISKYTEYFSWFPIYAHRYTYNYAYEYTHTLIDLYTCGHCMYTCTQKHMHIKLSIGSPHTNTHIWIHTYKQALYMYAYTHKHTNKRKAFSWFYTCTHVRTHTHKFYNISRYQKSYNYWKNLYFGYNLFCISRKRKEILCRQCFGSDIFRNHQERKIISKG